MQERTRYVIKHCEGYLNRMADGVTKNIFSALWFHTKDEADKWMLGIYAPKEGFEVVKTLTVMKEVDHGKLFCGISED
jgi:L-lactate utilization protein LutB